MTKILKKATCAALAAVLAFSANACFADESAKESGKTFVTVKTPFPETISDINTWRTYARYKDSGKPIPLSEYYNGAVYATVPAENADLEIEAFVPEKRTFTDIDDTSDSFEIEWMSQTDVIRGNEKGEAQPQKDVTRAEAVTMLMRFMGLDTVEKTAAKEIFADVKETDWHFKDIMTAYECGIVKGDSETQFSPDRTVTREELTTMTARALQYADLRCPAVESENIADRNKVSSWAKEAFDYIGVCYVYDYSETEDDWENPQGFLNPQKNATRLDTAHLLNSVQNVCQLYASDLATEYGFDKEMPVIDGSTSTHPFTYNVYECLFANGRTHPQYPNKHSKSHASYERLINGEVDMLFASVYPASDILELAEKSGVELELIPIAYDAMVFFTNADNPATNLTQEQITDIYVNNAYENWSLLGGTDALLYPYCRNSDSGSHAQMERHFLHGNEIHPEVQKETSYTMSNVLTDVMGSQTSDPVGYALGYSIYYYFNNMDIFYDTKTELKLLSIDGVMPSDETIADGTYPLSNNTYVVLRKDTPENSPARKMAQFMLTEAGQQCVANAGFGVLYDYGDGAHNDGAQ